MATFLSKLRTMSLMSIPLIRWDDNKRVDHLFSAGLNNDFRLAEHTHLTRRSVLFVQQA